jgi:hypothetical protein
MVAPKHGKCGIACLNARDIQNTLHPKPSPSGLSLESRRSFLGPLLGLGSFCVGAPALRAAHSLRSISPPAPNPLKQRKPVPHAFVLEALAPLSPYTRPMFGCLAVYVKDKIVLILRDRPTNTSDNGVWFATTRDHHDSLRREFPNKRSIHVRGKPARSFRPMRRILKRRHSAPAIWSLRVMLGSARCQEHAGPRHRSRKPGGIFETVNGVQHLTEEAREVMRSGPTHLDARIRDRSAGVLESSFDSWASK